MRNNFIIPDSSFSQNSPISESHYYQWLRKNAYLTADLISTKMDYLLHVGFDSKDHKLSKEDYAFLEAIEVLHFRFEVPSN